MEIKPKQLAYNIFDILSVDKDGKFFEKTSRIHGKGKIGRNTEKYAMELTLDINDQIYPMEERQTYSVQFNSRLGDDDTEGKDELDEQTQKEIEDWDYIMHGYIYKIEVKKDGNGEQVKTVFASYGGLLMKLVGLESELKEFVEGVNVDKQQIYILVKKI